MEVIAKIVPWEPFAIMPLGDIQYDGPGGTANLKKLKRHVTWGLERGVQFLGMGDFVDFLSPSNRERLAEARLYETAGKGIDRLATMLEDELMEVLEPTKGHWLGLVQGHHYYEHRGDGTTSDTRFAARLDAPYLGDNGIIRLTFKGKNKESAILKIWVHHGSGTGTTLLSGLNKLIKQKPGYPGVRLFIMGHVPQLGHVPQDGLDVTDKGMPYLFDESTYYIMSGGFARSHQQGSRFGGRAQGGYAEKGMMLPAILGGALIQLTPETIYHHGTSYRTIDIKVTS